MADFLIPNPYPLEAELKRRAKEQQDKTARDELNSALQPFAIACLVFCGLGFFFTPSTFFLLGVVASVMGLAIVTSSPALSDDPTEGTSILVLKNAAEADNGVLRAMALELLQLPAEKREGFQPLWLKALETHNWLAERPGDYDARMALRSQHRALDLLVRGDIMRAEAELRRPLPSKSRLMFDKSGQAVVLEKPAQAFDSYC